MTQLITEDEIKSLTDIGDNVDIEKFCHYIPIAQQKKIRNAIGTDCFVELLDQVKNNTLTTANNTLLNGNGEEYEGLKPALAWWVLFYAYPSLHSTVTNTGLQTRTGENFSSVDSKILEIRRNQAKDQAEYYLNQAICFIRENSEDYLCYDEGCCDELETQGYGSSGIVLDNSLRNRVPNYLTNDVCRKCGNKFCECV